MAGCAFYIGEVTQRALYADRRRSLWCGNRTAAFPPVCFTADGLSSLETLDGLGLRRNRLAATPLLGNVEIPSVFPVKTLFLSISITILGLPVFNIIKPFLLLLSVCNYWQTLVRLFKIYSKENQEGTDQHKMKNLNKIISLVINLPQIYLLIL